jgi:hypothetical protein
MIGVQLNSISIAAHELRQAGTISNNRGHIDIDDPQSLETTSCQRERLVKAPQYRLLKVAVCGDTVTSDYILRCAVARGNFLMHKDRARRYVYLLIFLANDTRHANVCSKLR